MSATSPLPLEQATTSNPPNLDWNTRVIGLCGAWDGLFDIASPKEDGWFISDFYALKGTLTGMGASQRWFTCLDPKYLVDKYEPRFPTGPYIQGDPYEDDRAVVLSSSQINEARRDLCVVRDDGSNILRETFLEYFRKECQNCVETGGRLLFIACSHGDFDTGGLLIGSSNPTNYLMKEHIAQAVREFPTLKLTTFLTSCYSAHWVITPEWELQSHPTVGAAAQLKEPSQSWSMSTAGRFAGGPMATYVLKEILKEFHMDKEPKDTEEQRSWTEWCDAVRSDMAMLRVRGDDFGSMPDFSKEGGHDSFWTRTGYPLKDFAANWSRFPKLPKSQHASPQMNRRRLISEISSVEQEAWEAYMATSPWREIETKDDFYGTRTGSWSGTRGVRLRSTVQDLARIYLNSNPGLNTIPTNQGVYANCRKALERRWSALDVASLELILSYRLHTMHSAESLLKSMGITSMCPISQWVWEEWSAKEIESKEQQAQKEDFLKCLEKTSKWSLCSPPAGADCGPRWMKPARYLAAGFAMSNKDPQTEFNKLMASQNFQNSARSRLQRLETLRKTCQKASSSWRVTKPSGSPTKRRSVKELFGDQGNDLAGVGPSGTN
jgi:hypothetical protein